MTSPVQTPRERAAIRALAPIYAHFGKPAQLIPLQGATLTVRPKFRVIEAEEGMDGSKIEARIKGYSATIRTSELGELSDLAAMIGGRLELQDGHTFDGYEAFSINAEPLAWGREGTQRLFSLSAAPDIDEADLA